jgi:hyperosmotically inducible protein
MKTHQYGLIAASALIAMGFLSGCSNSPAKSTDVSTDLRRSLDQAGLQNIGLHEDRDKGVITLSGNVAVDNDKARAETIALSMAAGQVVANQIAVLPAGAETDAKAVNSDLDQGIGKNLDAALIQNNLRKDVEIAVKGGVVTLKGNVNSEALRTQAQGIAAAVPNVQQVVNELQVKNQKASSS